MCPCGVWPPRIVSSERRPHSVSSLSPSGDDQIVEQIVKQLRKLVTVVKVVDLTEFKSVQREMYLIKINAEDARRAEILRIVDIFRCKVVDVSLEDLTIEVTGNQGKCNALISLLQRFGIKEIAHSGTVAMKRTMQLED